MMNLFSKSLKFSGNYPNNTGTAYTVVTSQNANNHAVNGEVGRLLAQAKDAWIGFGASIVDFFHSYQFKEIIFTLKVISFILSLLVLLAIIFIFLKMQALGGPKKKAIKKVSKKWAKIERKFESGTESNYKLAILDADNLYESTLSIVGSDKEKILSNLEEFKKAKQIKRIIVDDSGFVLVKEEARNSLNAYKKGLEELGAL